MRTRFLLLFIYIWILPLSASDLIEFLNTETPCLRERVERIQSVGVAATPTELEAIWQHLETVRVSEDVSEDAKTPIVCSVLDELMIVLERNNPDWPRYIGLLESILKDANQAFLFRDFAVQHLCYNWINAGEQQAQIEQLLWAEVDAQSRMAGACIRGLSVLHQQGWLDVYEPLAKAIRAGFQNPDFVLLHGDYLIGTVGALEMREFIPQLESMAEIESLPSQWKGMLEATLASLKK
jgi:hypothetical protein